MRLANPDDLDHLAGLLDGTDGQSGAAFDLTNAFTRASNLGARSELFPLNSLETWLTETAADLRRRATILRGGSDAYSLYGFGSGMVSAGIPAVYGSIGLWGRFANGVRTPVPMGMTATHLANYGAGREVTGVMARMATGGGRMSPAMARFLGGSHNAAMYLRPGQAFIPSAQQANLFRAGASQYTLMRGYGGAGRVTSFTSAMGTAGRTAGLLRGAGVAGSAFGTAAGVADLVSRGNPVEAFQNDPSGYSVAVTGTAFNASMTAALIAPNPVTVGAAVVTGVAYAGTLVWDNWDTLTDWQTYEDIGSAIGDGAEAVGDAIGDGVEAVGDFLGF